MSDELKPCPFCGAEAMLKEKPYHTVLPLFEIRCAKAGCEAEINGWVKSKTIKAWNIRVNDKD